MKSVYSCALFLKNNDGLAVLIDMSPGADGLATELEAREGEFSSKTFCCYKVMVIFS